MSGEEGPRAPGREGASGGADRTIADLYRRHYRPLRAFVRRRFGPGPPDPEDVVQASFARFAALPDPSQVRDAKAFLYRCASNYVIDFRRRQAVSGRAADEIAAINSNAAPAEVDPARVLEAREDLAAVMAAIESLDPRRRDVLILHSIEGLSYAEIARRLGVSPTRVIQLYAQAIAACAKALDRSDPAP